ncbi:hypothetical protein [Streptomyces sp. AC602_WCS936]|uniref:hypothetical protein n=1 Tax=Streptomyces sp. AC602_WCS936 TaxID=2823685 RepID=UPI001C2696D7|nr:hypothetical protein [Streptomyces sp. AC602_WCS936]
MNEENLRKAREKFARHIANLFDSVIARDDFPELVGMYMAGDLVFQVHDGAVIMGRRDIDGPPDEVPEEWIGGDDVE